MKVTQALIAAFAVSAIAGAGAVAQPQQGGRPLSATLTGAAEVPGPGDADGTGSANLTVNPGQEEICYEITVSDIATAGAAHIHEAAEGAAGPPVVTLEAPSADGSVDECVDVTRELAMEILMNPQDYYVNVHNAEFGAGAVRGQLSR
jgi:hypothetical protein